MYRYMDLEPVTGGCDMRGRDEQKAGRSTRAAPLTREAQLRWLALRLDALLCDPTTMGAGVCLGGWGRKYERAAQVYGKGVRYAFCGATRHIRVRDQ